MAISTGIGIYPLYISGNRRPGALLRLQDSSRGIATCGLDPLQFDQATPSSVWTINHNMRFKPSVRVFNPGGREMLSEIVHTSEMQTVIYFDFPVTGFVTIT